MPTPASPPDARTASPPDAGPAPDRERQPIVALANRAARHAPGGALRTGLARGMMATTRKEQLALEVAADRLWGVTSPPTDGIRTLIGLADQGCVGASAMLASLGSPRSIRTLSVLVADESAPRLRRLAAIRGALVAWQASREQQLSTPVPLLAALRRAGREKDEQIRYIAVFTLAMMGRREVRPVLEHGLGRLRSAPLLSYCVLGLREVGNGASAQAMRRLLPRSTGSLAEITHEAVQAIEMRLRPPLPPRPTLPVPPTAFHTRDTVLLAERRAARRTSPTSRHAGSDRRQNLVTRPSEAPPVPLQPAVLAVPAERARQAVRQ